MPKYETVIRADFDADESFKKAFKVIGKYLKKNEADGKMAMVSLARALGGTLMLTTEEEERDMALATVITQMCQTFADFLQAEDQEPRTKVCEDCDGVGWVETEYARPQGFDRDIGCLDTRRVDCETCHGNGEVEIEDE